MLGSHLTNQNCHYKYMLVNISFNTVKLKIRHITQTFESSASGQTLLSDVYIYLYISIYIYICNELHLVDEIAQSFYGQPDMESKGHSELTTVRCTAPSSHRETAIE